MHPSEMKNCALVAAARAAKDGFTATAEALLLLAEACAAEARQLGIPPPRDFRPSNTSTTYEVAPLHEVIH
jgi:hypothetical protein